MRALPPALAARLADGAVTLARCWRLVRRDGVEVCATDHDRPLPVDGRTYQPATALAAGHAEHEPGRDRLSVTGALDVAGISEDDLILGRWHHARVELLVADWRDPAVFVRLWSGRIGRVTRRDRAFELDLENVAAALDAPVGRVFARSCDAVLGDARCGVDLDQPGRSATASLVSVPDARTLVVTGHDGPWPALPWTDWAGSKVQVQAGRLVGTSWPVQAVRLEAGLIQLTLAQAMPLLPSPGDAVRLVIGCDHSFATCRDRFANQLNFRGCPLMPGDDAVLSGPAGSGNDGGRR